MTAFNSPDPTSGTLPDHPSDVLIVGAGPAGLGLAAALADAGLTSTVCEQQPLAALQQPADDGREIALTHRARGLMEKLGLWAALPADEVSPLNEARVLDGSSPQALRFAPRRSEPLGWLVPNHRIRAAAWTVASRKPQVRIVSDARVTALDLAGGDGTRAQVTLADGRTLRAALVVAADSRFSSIRRLAGIGAAMRDFGRSVVVGPVAHSRPHDGIAWECFRYGNTLALLPMAGNRSSAVVTLAADAAAGWLALSDAEFAARIQAQADGRLGEVSAAGARQHYPLVGVYAQRFVAPRFALVGDAAVGMHPVTAHGWNFGLYGIDVLSRQLAAARAAGRDLGALQTLKPYETEHRRVTWPIYQGTNAVVGLFTDERRGTKLLRRAVLGAAEHLPGVSTLVKSAIVGQLTGRGGLLAG